MTLGILFRCLHDLLLSAIRAKMGGLYYMDLRKMGLEGVDWINLAQDMNH
jgi:hypothetical protein